MPTVIKRCISLLLILMLVVSLIPSVYAAETADEADPAASTETTEETMNTEPEENMIPPPNETEEAIAEEPGNNLSEADIIDDSEPPVMLLIDGEVALASISNCQATTWATIWVNTDEYSPIAGKTNRFIYYNFAGKSRNRNNVGLKAIKVNGTWQAAYCLEPGIAEGSTYTEEDLTMDEFVSSSAAPSTLTVQQMKAMCVAVMYGQRTLPQSASYELLSNMVATQIIVWEIAIGWRNATPPYAQTNDAFIRRFENAYGKGPEATSMYISIGGRLKNVISAYNQISANMAAHSDAIPSFTSAAQNAAPTIDLKPNGNGQYSAAVTDSNRVISGYSFPKKDGLTFTTNGDVLTITSDRPLDNVLVAPTRNRVNTQGHPFFVWYNGSYQVMLGSQADPSYEDLPVYFRVRAVNPTGSMKLVKTTEDGKNLSGWKFGIYSDSGCSNLISGPHTTNSSGEISVTGLSAGTYYVKELGHLDSTINALYYCSSTNPQSVTVTAGATATVSFTNKLNTGGVKLVKTTNTGTNLSGWQIGLYSDAACTSAVTGSPFTIGSDGTVSVTGLTPGTYYAKEVAVSDPYWACDSEVKSVTVTPNATATATFSNTHYGDLRIQKNAVNGSAEEWSFQILDADKNVLSTIKTGADGYAYSDKLLPGQYYVREVHDRDDTYWEYDATVEKQVTVTAGSRAEVSYINMLYGRIEFNKNTNTGHQLGGWAFRVKDTSGNFVGEYTTDENGYACTEKLAPGRYLVYEVSSEDAYWNCELGFHEVTVKAGETVTDTWLNKEQGLGWFYKKTNTGESVEGWHITIYADEACTQEIGTLITNEDGKAGYYLDPGTYWAMETGDEHGRFEDEYWMVDETVQKFEIKPHEDVSITFTNVQYGRLKITKTVEGDGSVEGWLFKITDAEGKVLDGSPFASDKDGIILTGNLLPGTYTIEELLPEDSLYECKGDNPQTVTVKQGEIAEPSFTNALRAGKITIEKIDTAGEHLAGATFLLEWSAEGSLWYPVKYSGELTRGGCSNSALVDGTLTTGADGLLEWGGLYPGLQYRVTELKAPNGYELLKGYAFEGQLPVDDLQVSLQVINAKGFSLPDTGVSTGLLLRISQILCAAVCAALLLISYKKKRW